MEKQSVMRDFCAFCRSEGITSLEGVTKPRVHAYLSGVADRRGPHRSNVYRKNLLAASKGSGGCPCIRNWRGPWHGGAMCDPLDRPMCLCKFKTIR
ncbi:MAG: hypothetical protein FWF31_00910, partial [Desulfobulbus sp.]|nr:hypothetical protein [Desulfobulbus sp.]